MPMISPARNERLASSSSFWPSLPRTVTPPRIVPHQAGEPVWEMTGVTVRGKLGQKLLDDANLSLRAGEIIGIAGVSGNGQSSLADLISGLVKPESGQVRYRGQAVVKWHPATMVAEGIARIPEDRHAVGLVGDMSVAENVIAECYRQPPFSKRGLIDWSAARDFAQRIIRDYEVKCPSPQAITRLLSGGNMQKLILGRVLSPEPVLVLANQPTRGLDIGAVTYVHQQLLAVRQRGGAVLLISEDLDEVLALSDRVVVMYHGRLSAPMLRAAVNIQQLGLMMAGQDMRSEGHAA
ncbi:MAG: ATP-binding cassette domain-containing protein [Rhodospirillaceae bacterium]|nr:MAG: ATP-binding cassette domain-containing protein [Rhodospirillaceae bacterium]